MSHTRVLHVVRALHKRCRLCVLVAHARRVLCPLRVSVMHHSRVLHMRAARRVAVTQLSRIVHGYCTRKKCVVHVC